MIQITEMDIQVIMETAIPAVMEMDMEVITETAIPAVMERTPLTIKALATIPQLSQTASRAS